MKNDDLQEDLDGALCGDAACQQRLIAGLTRVIQTRVAHCLWQRRGTRHSGRDIRQEVEDLVQDVFLHLFADDCKILRRWAPERGLTLAEFVGLVAKRQAASVLRSARRSPWTEEPTADEDLEGPGASDSPEQLAASREELELLLGRLKEKLTDHGWTMFDLLFVQELSLAEVVERTGQTPDAVYAWRSRLRQVARSLRSDLSEPD